MKCGSCQLLTIVHKSVADRGDRLVQPNALHDGGICPKCRPIPVILHNPAVCDSTGEIAYRPYITGSAVGYFHFARLFSSIAMLFRSRYIVSSRRLGPMTKVPNFLCPSSSDILDPPL